MRMGYPGLAQVWQIVSHCEISSVLLTSAAVGFMMGLQGLACQSTHSAHHAADVRAEVTAVR